IKKKAQTSLEMSTNNVLKDGEGCWTVIASGHDDMYTVNKLKDFCEIAKLVMNAKLVKQLTTSRVMVSSTNIKSINRMAESLLPGSAQIDNILPKTKMVTNAQLERKQKLASELSAEKQRLEIMEKKCGNDGRRYL
ncbi:TGF-beta-activated kinase 1 and MAP3K7-binding protein 2, partial [Aphis craccivora]